MKEKPISKGYKAFNSDMTNRYGMAFEEGKDYHMDGEVKFGNEGNGFHFCQELEDTFRYFDADKGVKIAVVTPFGEMARYDDEYNGYYDMYSAEGIHIDHILNREEIIAYMLGRPEYAVYRFIQTGFKLTSEEKELFRIKFSRDDVIKRALDYYQPDEETKTVGVKKM